MREAADAARIGSSLVAEGGAVSYEQLGAYRYLVHLELDDAPRDRYRQSVEKLIEYDRRRGARLVETLEQYLADRGSVTASARALYVHPNTVRQRLDRIERVASLDLSSEDLLSLELALKLVRLHRVGPSRTRSGAHLGGGGPGAAGTAARPRRSRSRSRSTAARTAPTRPSRGTEGPAPSTARSPVR